MAKRSESRDSALLYTAQRLGDNPKLSRNAIYRELKQSGRGYRKTEFLKDFEGLTGTPRTIKPGAIKGGILSGVMRRKDVKALSESDRDTIKNVASKAIDATASTGQEPWKKIKIVSLKNGKIQFDIDQDFEEIEDLGHEEEITDTSNIGELDAAQLPMILSITDHIYERLT